MARIRTIKPEFWTSEQVMACKPITRLLFIGMWNFADDQGRMAYAPATIKAQVLPSDPIDVKEVRDILAELSSLGLILIYSANNKEYIEITGWSHQKIDKRFPSKIPGPMADAPALSPQTAPIHAEESKTTTLPPDPPRPSPTPPAGVEWNGVEGSGVEKKDAPKALPDFSAGNETDLYRRGKQVLGNNSGGMIKKLVKSKGGNIPLARAAIETASTKNDPREYIGAIIRGRDSPDDARSRGDAW